MIKVNVYDKPIHFPDHPAYTPAFAQDKWSFTVHVFAFICPVITHSCLFHCQFSFLTESWIDDTATHTHTILSTQAVWLAGKEAKVTWLTGDSHRNARILVKMYSSGEGGSSIHTQTTYGSFLPTRILLPNSQTFQRCALCKWMYLSKSSSVKLDHLNQQHILLIRVSCWNLNTG